MTPGSLYAELVRLQDAYGAAEAAARTKRGTSPAGVAKKAASDAYDDFKRKAARDLFVMIAAASEQRGGLDEIADRVARILADRLDFDAVAAQSHHASVKVMEARHETENLRREVEELRRQVETMQYEKEKAPLRVVG